MTDDEKKVFAYNLMVELFDYEGAGLPPNVVVSHIYREYLTALVKAEVVESVGRREERA